MDLYQELILDHSKHPQHAGLREPFGAESHHVNTSCGDEITLRVDVEGVAQVANPIRMSATPASYRRRPPRLEA